MTKNKITILFGFLLFISHFSKAQELKLEELWNEVKLNYSGINSHDFAIEASKINETATQGNKYPKVKVQAQNSYGSFESSMGGFFPQAGFFNINGTNSFLDGSSASFNTFGSALVEWEVFSFGRMQNEIDVSKSMTGTKKTEKEAYLLNLKSQLSARYIDFLFNQAHKKWNDKRTERLKTIYEIAGQLASSGLIASADSLISLAAYNQSLGKQDAIDGNIESAEIRLKELYDYPSSSHSQALHSFLNSEALLENEISTEFNISHPKLQLLEKKAEYAELQSEAERKTIFPSVKLLAGYSFRGSSIDMRSAHVSGNYFDGFSNSSNNFLVGVGLTWDITNFYTKRIKGESFMKEAESVKSMQKNYENALKADLHAIEAKIKKEKEALFKLKEGIQQSDEAYNMYFLRYESGLIRLSDLLQIQLLVEEAEKNHIEALYDYWKLRIHYSEMTDDFDFLFRNL